MSRARDTADQINRINSSAADATAITVDSSENVGIGTSSIDGTLHLDSGTSTDLIIEKDNAGSGTLRFHNDGSQVSYIELDASEDMVYYGASGVNQIFYSGGSERMRINESGVVRIGGQTGTLQLGNDGTYYADIEWEYNNNELAFSSNSGANFTFNSGGTERMRILSGGGITFNGDTTAANALDDYEEGTFALNNAGDGTGVVASTGKYVKIGRQVTVHAIANVTTNFTSQAMDGLPFAPSHVTTFSSIHGAAVCIGANVFAVNCNSGTTRVEFRNTSHAATAPTTGPIRFTMVYQTT
jgi:hypothetical protein